jgi:tetratricopeptide (TPR) repeat protein
MLQRRNAFLLLLGLLVVGIGAARADTVILRDGTTLKGKVIERPDGRIEVETKNGSRILERSEIADISHDGVAKVSTATADRVFLIDGRILVGNVTFSDDGKEIILSDDKRGESRFPRHLIKSIEFRTGHKPIGAEVAMVSTEEEAEKKWKAQIDVCIARLRDPRNNATPNDKDKADATKELLELGIFAINYVKAEIAKVGSDDPARPVLVKVLKVAELKTVVPAKVEASVPGICELLVEDDVERRIKVVNQASVECPDEVAPLLVHLIETDPSPKIKSICVGQLSILKRYDELAEVLKMREHGQWRLVAALELGEAGIYIGVPVLIEALKLDDPKFLDVRKLAIEKLKTWTGQGNLGYLPESEDKTERETAIARWEAWWKAEGETWAKGNSRLENAEVSDENKAKALDAWRGGNRTLSELQKKLEEATRTGAKVDDRDTSYAYESAAYLFKQAYDLDPTLSSARLSRAIILYQQLGQPGEAEGELKLVLSRFAPEKATYLRVLATTHLARICELQQRWSTAESYWRRVRLLDTDNIEARVGIGDAWLEQALQQPSANDRPKDAGASPEDEKHERERERQTRDEQLVHAVQAYKDALDAVDRKRKGLRDSVTELSGTDVEDFKQGQLLSRIREDNDSLVKRASEVWFRLGRAESARGNTKEALTDFKSARSLDPKNEKFVKAVEIWEKLALEKP